LRTGNRLFLIAYVMTCLLSGTHSAGVPVKMEQAIISMWDFFASMGDKETHADEACLFVVYALNGSESRR